MTEHYLTRYVVIPATHTDPACYEAECACGEWDEWHEANFNTLVDDYKETAEWDYWEDKAARYDWDI